MKIIILLLFLIVHLFGSIMEQNYKELNAKIDNVADKLSTEERLSLYYLVISSHDKLVTKLLEKSTELHSIDNLKERTLKMFVTLQKNNSNITTQDIMILKDLYLVMYTNALIVMEQRVKKIEKIDNNKLIKKIEYSNLFISSYIIFSIFITLTLGYLLYLAKKKNVRENFPHMLELEHQNEQLYEQNQLLKSNAKFIEENIGKNNEQLKNEKSSLIIQDKEMYYKIEKLAKELEDTSRLHEKFITTQEREIEDLNKYINSLKLEIEQYEHSSIHTYLNYSK